MAILEDKAAKAISPKNPLDVRDVGISIDATTVSGETVTFITGAVGFARSVSLDKCPILGKRGNRVGSFWRSGQNVVDGSDYKLYSITRGLFPVVVSVTETAGSAAAFIENTEIDMEVLFETPSGTKDFVLVVRDKNGATLHGWIAGISTSGPRYTFTVYSTPTGTTQDWNGSTSTFDNSGSMTYEIFYYDTSFSWGTGTILTQEAFFNPHIPVEDQLRDMANGDFAIDYRIGLILYKKATTGTSDTASYRIPTSASSSASSSSRYAIQIDEDTSTNVTYIGWALPGSSTSSAIWRITKINDASSPDMTMTWADSDDNFDNVWVNRTSLTYG